MRLHVTSTSRFDVYIDLDPNDKSADSTFILKPDHTWIMSVEEGSYIANQIEAAAKFGHLKFDVIDERPIEEVIEDLRTSYTQPIDEL